jgi:hypothetical protein
MRYFEPDPTRPIASEMIRQGFAPTADEALEICHLDDAASGTDTTLALTTAAVAVGCSAGVLALSGITLPILLPLIGLGYSAVTAWNSKTTVALRGDEEDFLTEHGAILDLAEQKLIQGQPAHKVAAALDSAFRAHGNGDQPQISLPTAAPNAISTQTQLQAIPVPATPAPAQPPETYPMSQAEVSPDDRRALITRLRGDCPALLKLVKSHPIRAVGVQRSGKSTLVKKLALLRMILLPGHRVIAATPHYEPENPYPKVFQVAGVKGDGQRDYPAIAQQWDGMAATVERCRKSNMTYVWDEFGLFDKVMDEEKIKSVLTSCLRETMKFECYPVFILHGETAAVMPGSKGLVTAILGGTVRVETIGEPIPDELGLESVKPTGKFNVTWLDGSTEDGQIPGWLTEDYLLRLIGHAAPPSLAPTVIPCPEPEHTNRAENPKPVTVKNTTAAAPTKVELIEQQIADHIRAYPPGNGGIKLRDLKRKFRTEDPKKVEGIVFTLTRCYPGKFRLSESGTAGSKTVKVEAIS